MFEIRVNGEFLGNRRAWNASIRAIERAAWKVARKNGVYLYLIDAESIRDESGFGFECGHRIWSGGGLELKFTISKAK